MSLQHTPGRVGKPITVTVPDALALTGLGRTKLYALIGKGKVRTIKIGARTLVVYASLEELTTNGDDPSTAKPPKRNRKRGVHLAAE